MGSVPGALALAAVKLGLVYWTRTLPPEQCEPAYSIVGGIGWGATAANIVTLTLAPPLWAAIVAGVGAGIGTGILTLEHVAENACRRDDMSVFQ